MAAHPHCAPAAIPSPVAGAAEMDPGQRDLDRLLPRAHEGLHGPVERPMGHAATASAQGPIRAVPPLPMPAPLPDRHASPWPPCPALAAPPPPPFPDKGLVRQSLLFITVLRSLGAVAARHFPTVILSTAAGGPGA